MSFSRPSMHLGLLLAAPAILGAATRQVEKGKVSVRVPIYSTESKGLSPLDKIIAALTTQDGTQATCSVYLDTPDWNDNLIDIKGEVVNRSSLADAPANWPDKVLVFKSTPIDAERTRKAVIKDGDKIQFRFVISFRDPRTGYPTGDEAIFALDTQTLDKLIAQELTQGGVVFDIVSAGDGKSNKVTQAPAEERKEAALSKPGQAAGRLLVGPRVQGGEAFQAAWSKAKGKPLGVGVVLAVAQSVPQSRQVQTTVLMKTRASKVQDLESMTGVKALNIAWEGNLKMDDLQKLAFPDDGQLYLLVKFGLWYETQASGASAAPLATFDGRIRFKDSKQFEQFKAAAKNGLTLGLISGSNALGAGSGNGIEVGDANGNKLF